MYSDLVANGAFNGSSNKVLTWPKTQRAFVIANDDATASLTFTIYNTSNFTHTLKAGESFDELVEPYTNVSVTATTAYRGYGRG